MAGDWIKMRGNLWDDPRVARLCDETDSTEATVIGALYWLWATADQHSEDGIMKGMTLRVIDRKTGVPGFAAALVTIGWLTERPEGVPAGVCIVRFDEHNGASAKKRSQTARRVARHRACNDHETDDSDGSNAPVTAADSSGSAASVTEALGARDLEKEKRRAKEKNTPAVAAVTLADLEADGLPRELAAEWLDHRKRVKAMLTPRAWQGIKREADKAGVTPSQAVQKALERGWRGFEAAWMAESKVQRPASPDPVFQTAAEVGL